MPEQTQQHDTDSIPQTHELVIRQSGSWEVSASVKENGVVQEEHDDKRVEQTVAVMCECGEEFDDYSQEAIDHIRAGNRVLPDEWEAGIGERASDERYTHNFYHDDYSLQVYSDPNEPHKALVNEVSENEDGDKVTGYPVASREADSEEKALTKGYELMYDISRRRLEG